jgi:hypothetical protein
LKKTASSQDRRIKQQAARITAKLQTAGSRRKYIVSESQVERKQTWFLEAKSNGGTAVATYVGACRNQRKQGTLSNY